MTLISMKPRQLLLVATIALISLGYSVAASQAKSPDEGGSDPGGRVAIDRVQVALADLHNWVDSSSRGQAWRESLRSADLKAQLAKGPNADRQIVAEILEVYSEEKAALKMRRFVDVRRALAVWLEDLSAPTLEELPAAARETKDSFVPVSEEDVTEAKAELVAAFNGLHSFLVRSGRDREVSWKKYLLWNDLRTQLAGDNPGDVAVLRRVLAKYTSARPGLELSAMVSTRQALRRYVDVVSFSGDEQAEEHYRQQLDALATALENHNPADGADGVRQIGQTLGWLERAGQADELIRNVRRHLTQPNLFVEASAPMVAAGIRRDVDQIDDVNDNILGTSINGKSKTVGKVDARMVPSATEALIEVQLTAVSNSNNVGYNGPVTIHSRGKTSISGRKRLSISQGGLQAQPATARCSTSTTVTGISSNRPAAQRVAHDRVARSKGEAEQIASRHAEQRVARRMNDEMGNLVTKANKAFREKFRDPLRRRDQFPRMLRFSTTADQLQIAMLHANEFQLAAPETPPELTSRHDLAVRLHQSFVNNFAESMLGGITLTDEQVAQLAKDLSGEVPEELQISDDKDPWSITFSRQEPISLVFTDKTVRIAIRGRRFTRQDQTLSKLVDISATYNVEKTETGSRMTRQGDVAVIFPGREDQQLGAREIAFKTFLRKKFSAMFEAEMTGEGLTLPGAWEKAGKLRLEQMELQNGWVALGWKMPDKSPAAEKTDTKDTSS